MTRFRPCIDLHEGRVKQIVGGTLKDGAAPRTNFVSDRDAAHYAGLYRENGMRGGHVIVSSWLFPSGRLDRQRLRELSAAAGPDRLVVDLSCRRRENGWFVAIDRWQTVTEVRLDASLFAALAPYCVEYLVHAADMEGLCRGVDWELVRLLAELVEKPATYAGGATAAEDLDRMDSESRGRIDLTIGSALDIFGGSVRFTDCAAWNRRSK